MSTPALAERVAPARVESEGPFDSTLALLRSPYDFIGDECRRLGTDVFRTRVMLQPTICMLGAEAARVFYDDQDFRRADAAPARIEDTLFGRGGVQGLDGRAHRHRKGMFMAMMGPQAVQRLAHDFTREWLADLPMWERAQRLVLFPAIERVLGRAVCRWAGVPLPADDVDSRIGDFSAMVDGALAVGPRHWRARLARQRTESWIADVVRRVRNGELAASEDSAVWIVAHHHELDGKPLDEHVAAVELVNVLCPTVAAARFVTFVALALHDYPKSRTAVLDSNLGLDTFVQEVRRFYPFFPFVAARLRHTFVWKGVRMPAGARVLFDLYGTNHDARIWGDPELFRPARFAERTFGPFELVPQGAGEPETHHRCAGEAITIALMRAAVRIFTRTLSYELPAQDLRIDRSRVPAIPKSRVVLSRVRQNP